MSKSNVYVVEDDVLVREHISRMLEDAGYNTVSFMDGNEVFHAFRSIVPDIILMDIALPGIDGVEIARKILKKYDIPIIFVTAHFDDNTFEKVIEISPYGYLIKPVDKSQLLVSVKMAIKQYELVKKEEKDRKIAEKTLKKNREKLDAILKSIVDNMYMIDENYNIIWANEKALQFTGNDIIGKQCYNVFKNRNKPCEISSCPTLMPMHNGCSHEFETRITDKKGNLICFHCVSNVALNDENGKPNAILEISRDITMLKKAEQLLIEKNRLFQTLFDDTLNPILVTNQNGKYLDANDAALEFLECDKDELRSKNILDFIPPDKLEQQKQDNSLVTDRRTVELEYNIHGKIKTLMLNIVPIELSGKTILYGIGQDITACKSVEDELKKSLKEKELLMRELHHRVKNNLLIIESLLNLQSLKIKEVDVKKNFTAIISRIRSMSLIHETLYQSKDLTKINLNQYITTISGYLRQVYLNDKIDFHINIEEIYLNIKQAIPCGLIINELVSNSLKHAFEGGKAGKITLDCYLEDRSILFLIVEDDGCGLPENFEDCNSLGMKLVRMLIQQLMGKFEFISNGGTQIKINFPIHN